MIFGMLGLMGSGKGTAGDILVEKHGFQTESFAKPLKDAVALIFNWPRDLLEGNTKEGREWREKVDPYWARVLEKPNFTPRLALQWFGTESGRNVFGNDLWTAALFNRLDPKKNYVITDVRFENEVQAVMEHGGKLILVERGIKPNWWGTARHIKSMEQTEGINDRNYLDDFIPGAAHIHRSEWDCCWTVPDCVIDNNGTLEELKQKISVILFNETQSLQSLDYWAQNPHG